MKKFKQKLMRTTAIFLTAVLIICAAPLDGIADTDWSEFAVTARALDASGSLGDNVTYTYNSETGEVVISGEGEMMGYSSPSSSPFFELKVKSVVIEDGVTSIGGRVFYGCTSLISVTIPDSIASIGSYAFYGCTSLESITIPDSITSIYDGAFRYCTSLESIPLGNGVTSIGLYAFYNTAYYSDANNWENGVLYIGNYLIEANKGLAGDYTIKSGTKVIADNAFYDTKLTSITIPDSVTIIGNSAFRALALTSITIPNSVISIGGYAFMQCDLLESVTILSGVEKIGQLAFYGCSSIADLYITDMEKWCEISFIDYYSNPLSYATNLYLNGELVTDLVIPDDVTSIGNFAFFGFKCLKSVTIPDKVISIGDYAFNNCVSLKSVTIPDKVISIGDSAFGNCASLESIIIPDSVTNIGDGAFSDCSGLASITIPDGVISIGANMFRNCTSLKNIEVGNNVERIEKSAFLNTAYYNDSSNWENGVLYIKNYLIEADSKLVSGSVRIRDNTLAIAYRAFISCVSLENVTIPDSVTHIGDYAFGNCTNLENVTIGTGVECIGKGAFEECTNLKAVNITDITKWCRIKFDDGTGHPNYTNPLYYASNLYLNGELVTDLVIPDGVTSISNFAFINCTCLESVTVPDSVTTMGHSFFGCSNLKNVYITDLEKWCEIVFIGINHGSPLDNSYLYVNGELVTDLVVPDGVTSLNDCVFYGCTGITNATIPDSVTSIGNFAFHDCTSLISITIPDSVTSMGEDAFDGCENLTDVYYSGSEEEWNEIVISDGNESLTDATIHFNSTGPEIHEHSYISEITTPATCTTDGVKTYTCSCEDSYTETIEATGHTEETIPAVSATCTSTGLTEGTKCSACGEILVEQTVTDKLPHTMGEWTTTQAPACTETGEEKRDCVNCDYYETNILSATGHTEATIPAVPATCTSTGLTEGTKCSVCGEILVEQTITEKLPHTMGEWTTTQAPACTETGEEKRDCVNCDYYETNILSATDHTEETIPAVPATCTSIGLTEGAKCSVCGEILVEQTVTEKISHSYKAVVTAATCTTGGYTTCTCSVCGDSYTDAETPALGHKMGEFTVIKIPTCTENGEEISECSRCDYSETQEISATGHNYENGVCANCGDNKTENCSCNCHKTGFMGFIWKILNFFYKIFGTNKICDCGIAHY